MQTIISYYYDNTVTIQFDIDSTCLIPVSISQRNRVVYTRPIKIYKGITNIVKIAVQNADQKPIDITGHTLVFNIVDDYVFANANVVYSTNVTISNASVGLGYVAIPGLDLVQLDKQLTKIAQYQLVGVSIREVGALAYDMTSSGDIQNFDVTLAYHYWRKTG